MASKSQQRARVSRVSFRSCIAQEEEGDCHPLSLQPDGQSYKEEAARLASWRSALAAYAAVAYPVISTFHKVNALQISSDALGQTLAAQGQALTGVAGQGQALAAQGETLASIAKTLKEIKDKLDSMESSRL